MGSMDLNELEKQWGCFDDDKSEDSKDDIDIKSLQSEGEDEEEGEDETDDILDSDSLSKEQLEISDFQNPFDQDDGEGSREKEEDSFRLGDEVAS